MVECYGFSNKLNLGILDHKVDRFPSDFMFQLTSEEWEILISQNVTSSWGGRRKLPFVFSELGVAMLSSVLNSKKAIQINIGIMRIFTRMRQMLTDNTDLRLAIQNIERKTEGNAKSIELLFEFVDELMEKKENPQPRKAIGFKPNKK
jgi:hypothetical protein